MRTGLSFLNAKELIHAHKKSYPIFWKWVGNAVDRVKQGGNLYTVFGWQYHSGPKTKHGTLLNFPMQANGAEMLRLACINATEARIKICAPVHDALLIEAPINDIQTAITQTQQIMAKASKLVLGDKLTLRSDVKIIKYPERYVDGRGTKMWETVLKVLDEIRKEGTHQCTPNLRTGEQVVLHPCAPAQSTYISPIGIL